MQLVCYLNLLPFLFSFAMKIFSVAVSDISDRNEGFENKSSFSKSSECFKQLLGAYDSTTILTIFLSRYPTRALPHAGDQ